MAEYYNSGVRVYAEIEAPFSSIVNAADKKLQERKAQKELENKLQPAALLK